jgi:hypothetical protein
VKTLLQQTAQEKYSTASKLAGINFSRQNITSNSAQCAKFSLALFSFLSTQSSLKLFSLMLYLSSKHQSSVVEEQEEDAK